jgi:hypothetical protein
MRKGTIAGAIFGALTPFLCVAMDAVVGYHAVTWNRVSGWLYPASAAMLVVWFGHPSAVVVFTFFAISVVLNAITFSLFGFLSGLIFRILFGKSDFIRTGA